ncbi:hypothetical protein DEU56DRAFT_106450 [Suillus clintonianus]|uniref:uncharacterized protein n=1 Tax=Suillus clintonianus TaxID=1904413 RepID=UPI001B882171|nr:uncharacterized protein DEU56DRAFT_106450 [Suillus clintonianus]KAG2148037.1 hypothetical protein DEU56DRAFT_106450 [Suillus clintonianus]
MSASRHWYPPSHPSYHALPKSHEDFDSIRSKSTAGTGTNFYDRSLTVRMYALVGVAFSTIISCCCITTGIVIIIIQGANGVTPLMRLTGAMQDSDLPFEILKLILNLLVTICTESTGFVHNISLRSALASDSRLRFNTNLRLLTAGHGWRNPNGTLFNGIMVILLVISYTSSSLVVYINYAYSSDGSHADYVAIAGLPLFLLGIALLLQVVIAIAGIRAVEIPTWSSSPFDLTAALVHHTQLTPVAFRCMRSVSDMNGDGGPATPSKTQPSAWRAHPSIRKVVIFLWVVVAACAGWGAFVMHIWDKVPSTRFSSPPLAMSTWSLSFNEKSNYIGYYMPDAGPQWWILVFINLAVVQGPLTLALHCSELIANVIRDERQWRHATTRKGLHTATNPLTAILTHPICIVLFVTKPFLHWMFGLSFVVSDGAADGVLGRFAIFMLTAQIWNLCIALFILACCFTFVALRRPRGPQPATYGHLQTLANVVDEWSPVMWWGHKGDGPQCCHAGTSDHPLPDVRMGFAYAGSDVKSSASVS